MPVPPPQQRKPPASSVTDYDTFVHYLREIGVPVEPEGEVAQPFFSIEGRMLQFSGEEVQVFVYPDAAAAEEEAGLVSPDGSTVGTSKPQWVGAPHFYRKGKILALYIGDNEKVLNILNAALDRQFAGKQ